ncbi:MAG: twin-arginine translocase TatA/TatE family subunit [Coriobacteriaceae bacterium]|nr:twin-arginine translocase TatA/TatE family subunit [Coriobacteriaceae bacterium]MDO4891367.1 twin-arginine translocase TatA/TatE family subunit [Coriobacteriaceae bacterium]
MPKLGPLELVVILVVVLLLFGPKNLPKLGSAIGKSVRNLREGLDSGKKDKADVEKKAAEASAEAEEAKPAPADQEEAEVVVEGKPAPKSAATGSEE